MGNKNKKVLYDEFEKETGNPYYFGEGVFYTLWLEDKLLNAQSPIEIWDAARSIIAGHGCNDNSFTYDTFDDYIKTKKSL